MVTNAALLSVPSGSNSLPPTPFVRSLSHAQVIASNAQCPLTSVKGIGVLPLTMKVLKWVTVTCTISLPSAFMHLP